MANLIVGDLTPRNQYTATSLQTDFTYSFPIFSEVDLKVYIGPVEQTLTTDYTVSGAGTDNGGTVTLLTGATTGDIVTVYRDMPVKRTSDYQNNGAFLAETINDDLDKLVMMVQQQEDQVNNNTITVDQFDEYGDLTLPGKAARVGRVLGFNATTGDPEAGPVIANVSSLAAITSDIGTLADIEDGTVATNAISGAAAVSADISTVAGISANVTTVALNDTKVDTVATSIASVNTVAANIAKVDTVATDIAKVVKVADDLLETVSEIETVANDLNEATSEIDTVATNIVNVNKVGVIDTNVTKVANIDSNVTKVANIDSNVTKVANIDSNVTAVANIDAEVIIAAGDTTEIAAVAAITSDVTDVAGITSAVSTVATNIASVNTVATDIVKVKKVADDLLETISEIETVADDLNETTSEIDTVAANIASVNTVGTNIASVNTVASNLTAVNSFGETYRIASSAPTTSLDSGDLYFDTATDVLKVYGSSGWQSAGSSINGTSERKDYIVGTSSGSYTGSTTTFPATYDAGYVDVYLNGVKLAPSDFTGTSGTEIVLSSAATVGHPVSIVGYGTFSVATVTLNDLTTVDVANPTDGQHLVYNSTSSKWESGTVTLPKLDSPSITGVLAVDSGGTVTHTVANWSDDIDYVFTPTNCTIGSVNTSGQFVVTHTSGSPSYDIKATTDSLGLDDSVVVTKNILMSMSAPTLSSPADEGTLTDVVYTITSTDTNDNKIILDIGSSNFNLGTVTPGSGSKVGNTVEITGFTTGNPVVTLQFTAEATYSVKAKSVDTNGTYGDSSYSATDSLTIQNNIAPVITGLTVDSTAIASYTWSDINTGSTNDYTIAGATDPDGTDSAIVYSIVNISNANLTTSGGVAGANNVTLTVATIGSDIAGVTFNVRATDEDGGTTDSAQQTIDLLAIVPYNIQLLLVAGGGGGTAAEGYSGATGGGGAGGMVEADSHSVATGTNYSIVVGGGGALSNNTAVPASSGEDSTGLGFTAKGGGGSVDYGTSPAASGGSGAGGSESSGAAGSSTQDTYSGTANVTGYGNAGAAAAGYTGGTGGGGGAGSAASGVGGGSIGLGRASDIVVASTDVTYATGGGGAAGNSWNHCNAGAAYTGNGSSGAGSSGGNIGAGANGGSGIVVLRILTSDYSGSSTGSPTITTNGSYTVLKYTGDGSYTA